MQANDVVKVIDAGSPHFGRVASVYKVDETTLSCRDTKCDFDIDESQVTQVPSNTALTSRHPDHDVDVESHVAKAKATAEKAASHSGKAASHTEKAHAPTRHPHSKE